MRQHGETSSHCGSEGDLHLNTHTLQDVPVMVTVQKILLIMSVTKSLRIILPTMFHPLAKLHVKDLYAAIVPLENQKIPMGDHLYLALKAAQLWEHVQTMKTMELLEVMVAAVHCASAMAVPHKDLPENVLVAYLCLFLLRKVATDCKDRQEAAALASS